MTFTFPNHATCDVVGIGRNSWDRIVVVSKYPKPNTKVEAEAIEHQAGGQVATTMVTMARLGCTARYLGKFGDDAAGRAVRGAFGREGVDISESKVVPGVGNQTAFIVVDRGAKTRNVFAYQDQRLELSPDDFKQEATCSGKIAYFGGRNPTTILPYAKWAKAAGCITSVDADSTNSGVIEMIEYTDILFCPEDIPQKLTSVSSSRKALEELSKMGPKIIVCTHGERGATAFAEGEYYEAESFDIPAIDTTGAGDVFQGAFLVGVLENQSIANCLQIGGAAAALKCTEIGGQKGIPTRKVLEEFLKTSKI